MMSAALPPDPWGTWDDETGITHIVRRRSGLEGWWVRCSLEGPVHGLSRQHKKRRAPTCLWCINDETSPRYEAPGPSWAR